MTFISIFIKCTTTIIIIIIIIIIITLFVAVIFVVNIIILTIIIEHSILQLLRGSYFWEALGQSTALKAKHPKTWHCQK